MQVFLLYVTQPYGYVWIDGKWWNGMEWNGVEYSEVPLFGFV